MLTRRLRYRRPHDLLHLTAPSCFLRLPRGAEAAALTRWKTFLHPEGDHFTLINIYKAYQDATLNSTSERKCVLGFSLPD